MERALGDRPRTDHDRPALSGSIIEIASIDFRDSLTARWYLIQRSA
jgi:hypothetical protein